MSKISTLIVTAIMISWLTTRAVDYYDTHSGIAILNGGSPASATITNSLVTTNTRIFLTPQTGGGTVGIPFVNGRSPGTSFTINSTVNGDTNKIAWLMVEPSDVIYVATNGLASNPGTFDSPKDIVSALLSSDTVARRILIRGGTYTNVDLDISLVGSASQRWVVMPYTNETAVFDAAGQANNNFTIDSNAQYVDIRDLIVMNSTVTKTNVSTSNPNSGFRFNSGTNIRLIGCTIHDTYGQGVACQSSTDSNLEILDCVIYNCGGNFSNLDHGIYAQNRESSGYKKFLRNVSAFNSNCQIQMFGSSSAFIQNMFCQSNVLISTYSDSPLLRLEGGTNAALDIKVTDNVNLTTIFNSASELDSSGSGVIVTNNRIFSYLHVTNPTNLVFQYNTCYNDGFFLIELQTDNTTVSSYGATWNHNQYYNTNNSRLRVNGTNYTSLATWTTATGGFDSTGSSFNPDTRPSDEVLVYKSDVIPYRAIVSILNWTGANNVNVDVSSVLTNGQSYTVKNAGNYLGSNVLSGVYSGGTISFPLTNQTYVQRIATNGPVNTPTNTFGIFIIKGS